MGQYKPTHRLDVNEIYELWKYAGELFGVDVDSNNMLSEMFNIFDSDTILWFLECINDDYELGLFDTINEL